MSTVGASPADLLRRLKEGVARSAEQVQESRMNGSGSTSDREAASSRTHLLGLLLAGAEPRRLATAACSSIGYGSRVALEDLDDGGETVHHLMSSEAMDLDAGHISIDSPLGQALLGRTERDVVEVRTPRGPRTFRIRAVLTLQDLLDLFEAGEAAGFGGRR